MRKVLAATIFCLCGGTALAQLPPSEELRNRVDAIAKQTLSRPAAGISIAVMRDGRVVLARGYGTANLEHSVPVTPETVFHIDSISKNILSAVILQLADEGKLRLDDDVTKYVPEAPTQGRHVTVRQLINHTSGIYSFTSLPSAANNERLELSNEQVLALIKDRPFDFEPGSRWRYDNSAFYLAGMLVERVTKQDYGTYLREHIFKPLGMSSASLGYARMVVPHLASGYEVERGALVNTAFLTWKLPFAGGAVCATATDLLKWQAALDSGRVLTPSSLALMRTPTTLADGTKIDYGLGTRLGSVDGHRVVGHTGSGGGYRTVLASFPDDHLTVAILINTDDGSAPPAAMAADIARAALGLKKHTVLDLTVPSEELATLSGKYDSDDGIVELFARDRKLHFRIVASHTEGVLLRQSQNVYAIDRDDNVEVHFVMSGRRAWSMVYHGGLFLDAKYRVN